MDPQYRISRETVLPLTRGEIDRAHGVDEPVVIAGDTTSMQSVFFANLVAVRASVGARAAIAILGGRYTYDLDDAEIIAKARPALERALGLS